MRDPQVRERLVLALLAGVQLTHILDFMVLMPLGPQLMRVFQVSPGQFGLLVSAYTFGAAAAGIAAAFHVDRFDRKHALLVIYAGFAVTTLLCALAPGFGTLLAARAAAGMFGGIAGAVVYAIVGDLIPEARRATATGVVASAFSLSAVAGVPLGLFLASRFGWRAPFVLLACVAVPLWVVAFRILPPVTQHLSASARRSAAGQLRTVFGHPNHRRAFALTTVMMFAAFSVIPFISAYTVANVGLRETDLTWLYLAGGLATFFTSRLIGRLADRYGKKRVFRVLALISTVPLLVTTNLPPVPVPVAILASVLFMVFVSGRFVPVMALLTASVEPRVRGSFLAFNSALQQLSAGLASFCAGLVLGHSSTGQITRYWLVGVVAVAATLAGIAIVGRLQTAGR